MKKIYFLFLLTASSIFSQAQVSVTATAGTTGPLNYNTLQEAVVAIGNGVHQGAIALSITANTTETASSVFVKSGVGAASYTAINITPAVGVQAAITGDIAGPLLDFNGANFITVNGFNTLGRGLLFSNANTTAAASCVRFTEGASNNLIQLVTLLGSSSSNTSAVVVFGTSAAGGNNNNILVGNRIGNATGGTPANGIYSLGTAGQENTSNFISGNLVYNYFQASAATTGIQVAANNSRWTLENNEFYQTVPRVFVSGAIHRGIQISGGEGYMISGNIIGGSAPNGSGLYELSGAGTRFTGIEVNVGVTSGTGIYGNRVQNLQITTTSGAGAPQGVFCGIYITGGNVDVGTVQGNTIGAASGNGSIRIIPSTGGSVVTGITYNSSGTVQIRNNVVGAIDLMPAAALSGNAFAVQVLGAGATVNIENNTLGGNSANSIAIGVKGTTTGNGLIRGIFTNNNGTMNIRNNVIQNLTHNSNNALSLFRAIECQVGTVTITKNTINNIAAEGTSVNTATHEGIGILVSTAVPNIVIDSNIISNLMLTNTGAIGTILSGIYIGSLNTGAQITRNKLYGFSNAATGVSSTTPPVAAAIYLRDVASGELLVANNMISLGSAQSTNTSFIGIWNQVNPVAGYTERLYYNSVNIDGVAAAGAQPSFAYYRGNFTTTFTGPTMDMKNNILINNRSGGTGSHYAIANSYGAAGSASGWGINASNYNVLNANAATIGYWSANQTIADWRETSQSDNNSLSGVAVTFVDPANDLHLVANANTAVEGSATPLAAVTSDADNEPRDGVLPDIGADELLGAVPVQIEFFRGQKQASKNLLEWKAYSNSPMVYFVVERSTDSRNFSMVGMISATAVDRPLSFYDVSPAPGLNYYRLKMVEADGNFVYSAVISLASGDKETTFSIHPNRISNGMANLYISMEKTTAVTATLTDASGKVLLKKALTIPAGAGVYPINISPLAKGMYYITLRNTAWVKTERVVVD